MKIKIKSMTFEKAETDGILSWPIWTCKISKFDWEYEEKETCYLIEGKVKVITKWETVYFSSGNFVIFPQGLKCHWQVISPVKKHYKFG